MARLWLLLTIAVALVLGLAAAPAGAAKPPPPIEDVSAIDQYRESIPTAGGPRATGQPGRKSGSLSRTARARIQQQGGKDAELLLRVVTASEYGAPEAPPSRQVTPARTRATLPAIPGASSGGSGYIAFLGVAFAGVAAVGAAFAVSRRRRT